MWKRVRTLFIKELSNNKFFQYLVNGHFEYGFNTSKIAKTIFAFIFILSLTIYLSRKVEVNKYLIKKISSNKSYTLRVNINSANEQELNNLPGIGPKLAKRIIEYRFTHGSFENLDEIRAVKGLGAKKFSQIENYLTVQP
ncbi:MAG: ComEA family DNA-binding protein [Vampirovibrionia bacterium]|jgi:comEA protein